MDYNDLLTEKLRPKNLKQLILLERVKRSIGEGKTIQNMIFSGNPGTGKCVVGDTLIKIKDLSTGKIESLKIKDLFADPAKDM